VWRVGLGMYAFPLLWPALHSSASSGVQVLLGAPVLDIAQPPLLGSSGQRGVARAATPARRRGGLITGHLSVKAVMRHHLGATGDFWVMPLLLPFAVLLAPAAPPDIC
jgi:hypothetical protein